MTARPGMPEVSEVQFRAILEGIPARVGVLDRDRRYRYVNREFAAFVGRPPEAIVGRTVAAVLGEAAYATVAHHADAALAGEAVRWEGWISHPTRAEQQFLQRFYLPLHDRDGQVEGYVVVARDLTELMIGRLRLTEAAAHLRDSEALNTAIIASALDCVVVMDDGGRVVEFNPAAERTFGHARAAAIGQPVSALIVPPALRARHAAGLRRYLETGQSAMVGRRIEVEAQRADGTTFPCELTITEVRLPERRLFTAHLRDLTQQRAAAAEIEAQRARIHQVEKLSAMGSLLAGVAHELNNPLAILMVQATLLREQAATPDVRRRAERIHAAAERSGRIVKSFLALARQEVPRREPVQLAAIVAAAVEMTAYGARSAGIQVEVAGDPDLPPVLADRDLLGQVVANLLINAQQILLDRPEPRRIWVTMRREDTMAVLEVADNGPGVPADIAVRVFEPYFTTKPAGAGTGIGLAICRNVVQAHGGWVELMDRPGGGALFRVLLPFGMGEAASLEAEAGAGVRGLSLLVVDDDADVATSLAEMLGAEGHRVTVRDNGGAALATARTGHFDAVFADLRMPGMDGPALRQALLAEMPQLGLRTVIVTGDTVLGAPSVRARAGWEGVPILEKPFSREEVRAALEQAMAMGQPPQS